jgi:hypothetical protein
VTKRLHSELERSNFRATQPGNRLDHLARDKFADVDQQAQRIDRQIDRLTEQDELLLRLHEQLNCLRQLFPAEI